MAKAEGPFILGTDVGTTGCKSELFALDGTRVGNAYREYPLIFSRPGWVEEDPIDGWWRATHETIREIITNTKVDPKQIAGISVSCTNALVPVDKAGEPLRNAIIQLDKRTVPQAQRIQEQLGDEVFRVCGNRAAPGGTSAPIILWIKENEPEIFAKTYKFMVPGGYVVQKLSGEFTMEWSRASWTCLFETGGSKTWSDKICDQLGIPVEKLPDTCPSWKVVGGVTKAAAELTGLAEGTPVLAGMADTPAAGLGTKAVAPGRTFHVIGTVGRPCVILAEPKFDSRFINCVHAVPDCWFTLGASDASGLSIKWFRDAFGQLEVMVGRESGENPFELLDRVGAQSPAGANGLIYLPYLPGERSPIWDPNARGVIFGLSVSHRRPDVLRAFFEGVAYAFMHNLEIYEKELGVDIQYVLLSGGGAKSAVWQQVHADVCNKPVHVAKVKESEALGNALLAGYGVGLFPDIVKAADDMVKVEKIVEPNPENHKRYAELFEIYKSIYLHLKEDFVDLARFRDKLS